MPQEVTYSIGEAAARTGLSRQGLLSWERRYGFPRPARNDKGHRRYSPDDLLAIALARASVHSGRDVSSAVEEALAARATGAPTGELPAGLMRDVLDNLPFPLAIVQAPTFEHVYVNRALVRAVPEVRLGSTVQSLPGVNDVSALERVARLGDPWHSQEQPIIIEGELRYFQVTWLRLASIEGRPPHLLGFGQETTEQARARRRLRRSAAAEEDRRLLEEARHSRFLRSLVATVNAGDGPSGALRTAVKRTCELLDADAAAVARIDGRAVIPTVSAVPTRGLRWRGFKLECAPQVERALERDALVWLQASRTDQRAERALLARMTARTLCAAPIVHEGRVLGALLVRWSLNEYQPSFDDVDYLELTRHLLAGPLARALAGELQPSGATCGR